MRNNKSQFPAKYFEEMSLKFVRNLQSKSKFTRRELYTNSISSRKNTPLSINTKCLLKFSNRLLFEKELENQYIFGDIEQEKLIKKWYYNKMLYTYIHNWPY